jgi:ubiquinone/menaquinone biosynthesis C-methylase UbiE
LFKLLDTKAGTEAKRMKYFFSFISDHSFDSIVDLGCGKGLIYNNIACSDQTALRTGIDLTRNSSKRYQHIVASATKLPFKDSVFSLVTAFSLIEHIPKAERACFYKEARRVMKRRGTFVIQFPNRYFVIESHTFLPFFGFLPSRMHSFAYRREYVAVPSLKEVTRSLEKYGFEKSNTEKYGSSFLPFPRFFSGIGFFNIWPMGYIVHTRKSEASDRIHDSTREEESVANPA